MWPSQPSPRSALNGLVSLRYQGLPLLAPSGRCAASVEQANGESSVVLTRADQPGVVPRTIYSIAGRVEVLNWSSDEAVLVWDGTSRSVVAVIAATGATVDVRAPAGTPVPCPGAKRIGAFAIHDPGSGDVFVQSRTTTHHVARLAASQQPMAVGRAQGGWVVDAIDEDGSRSFLLFTDSGDQSSARTLRCFDTTSGFASRLLGVEGASIFAASHEGGDTLGLIEIDVVSGDGRQLWRDARYDLETIAFDPSGTPALVYFFAGRLEVKPLTGWGTQQINMLAPPLSGTPILAEATSEATLIRHISDTAPTDYWVSRGKPRSLTRLGSERPDVGDLTCGNRTVVQIRSRRDTVIDTVITVPGTTRPTHAIVFPHGGHYFHDSWAFFPDAHWLAAHSVVCVQPNFPGSSGYGRTFFEAGFGAWGGPLDEDLAYVAEWIRAAGLVPSNRLGIFGYSGGALAALFAAANGEPFDYAIALSPVLDLTKYFDRSAAYGHAQEARARLVVGMTAQQRFERSPLQLATQFKVPLFCALSTRDEYSPMSEVSAFLASARQRDDFEYILLDDAHIVRRTDNRRHLYASVERFLSAHAPSAGDL